MPNVDDFIIYITPELMTTKCDFVYGWDKEGLFEMADLSDKTILDASVNSGCLTFAAAEKTISIDASEPSKTLCAFIREKIKVKQIKNIRVWDSFVTEFPFPDRTFDVAASGHIIVTITTERLQSSLVFASPAAGCWTSRVTQSATSN